MEMKMMNARFAGKCSCCKESFRADDLICWSKETGSQCLSCTYPQDVELPLVPLTEGRGYKYRHARQGTLRLIFRAWVGQNGRDALFHVEDKTRGGNQFTLHDWELERMNVRARLAAR